MRTLLHPKNWNAATWLAILFWSFWALSRNLPYNAGPASLVNFNALSDQYGFAAQDRMTAITGFPFTYRSVDFNTTQITGTSFSTMTLVSNVFLSIVSLICLIVICQRKKTFSLRSMFVGCTFIAVPLALYSYLSPGYPINHWCKFALFVSPQFAVILLVVKKRMHNHGMHTELPSQSPFHNQSNPATG
jgi:hypothetical protein